MTAQSGSGEPRGRGTEVETSPQGIPVAPEGSIPEQRIPESGTRLCTCGHPAEMHEHYREGSDCGACGRDVCAEFTADHHR
jgi:hypothetical protein